MKKSTIYSPLFYAYYDSSESAGTCGQHFFHPGPTRVGQRRENQENPKK